MRHTGFSLVAVPESMGAPVHRLRNCRVQAQLCFTKETRGERGSHSLGFSLPFTGEEYRGFPGAPAVRTLNFAKVEVGQWGYISRDGGPSEAISVLYGKEE